MNRSLSLALLGGAIFKTSGVKYHIKRLLNGRGRLLFLTIALATGLGSYSHSAHSSEASVKTNGLSCESIAQRIAAHQILAQLDAVYELKSALFEIAMGPLSFRLVT